MDISPVDWMLLAVLLLSALLGMWRGLIYEVLSLLSWVVAFVLAQLFATAMGDLLPMASFSATARYVAGFVLVFVLTLMACGLLVALLKKLVSAVGLRPIDRALGGLFGLVRGVLLLMLLVLLVSRTPLQRQPDWQTATGVKLMGSVVKVVMPMLPSEITHYLPDWKN